MGLTSAFSGMIYILDHHLYLLYMLPLRLPLPSEDVTYERLVSVHIYQLDRRILDSCVLQSEPYNHHWSSPSPQGSLEKG
jgi:hypothetical protein